MAALAPFTAGKTTHVIYNSKTSWNEKCTKSALKEASSSPIAWVLVNKLAWHGHGPQEKHNQSNIRTFPGLNMRADPIKWSSSNQSQFTNRVWGFHGVHVAGHHRCLVTPPPTLLQLIQV